MKKNCLLTELVCVPRHIAWYYMKFLHLQTGDELFGINFEFKWKQQPLRDHWQITFVMPHRFRSLSKNPFTPPSFTILMDNTRLHGTPTTSFEKVILWKVISYSYQFFYFLFYISFYISRYHFSNFLEFHSTLPEKNFRPKFSFLNGFTPSHQLHPLNGQNLLNVTKFFCWFSLKCLLKYFFPKNLLTKSCKAFF